MSHFTFLRPLALLVIAACFPTGMKAEEIDYEKEAAIEARLQQYLPRTLPKLKRRARVRVVVLGDEVSRFGFGPQERLEDSWHYQIISRLASKFYYGGGVRLFAQKPKPMPEFDPAAELPPLPPRGELPALDAVINGAPEIVLRNFSRKGATAIQALQPLTTEAFDDNPDLVIWMYGLNDALSDVPVAAYKQALTEAIKICQAHQTDILLATPSCIFGEDLRSLTSTQEYVHAALSVAKESKLLCWNMTAALGNVSGDFTKEPATAFGVYTKELQKLFVHKGQVDLVRPNAAGHELMAKAAWEQLLGEAPAPKITARGSFSLAAETSKGQPAGSPNLEISLLQQSTPDEPAPEVSDAMLTVLQQTGGWKRSGDATFALKPFTDRRTTRMPLESAREKDASLPLGDTATAGFVLYSKERAQLLSIDAIVAPISVDLPVQRLEGVAGDLLIDGTIRNKVKEEFHATAEIEWLGKKTPMTIALEGNSTKPLKLRLALPDGNSIHSTLHVRLTSGEHQFDFHRTIDATRNFKPDERLTFSSRDEAKSTAASLTVKVDPAGLMCAFDLPPAKTPGGSVGLMIDARDPVERGKPGFVETWDFNLPAQDGPIPIKKIPAAVFGNGYDREIDPQYIHASLKTEANNSRRVEISIPKQDFYLHQWSLSDRGQNTLGFNARIQLPDLPTPLSLTNSDFSPNDSASLGVLQLIPKTSGEWSVRVF